MTTIFVQFADGTDAVIISSFAGQQDPTVYPNLGTVDATDSRWKTYYDAQPSWVQVEMTEPAS